MRRSILASLFFLLFVETAFASAPVLFFSDLTWGPKTGWEGSATKGAAVSVWGLNFGSSGAINVCGQTLSSSDSTQVAEWAATTNPVNARGLQRITFWLNSSMSDGAGTISITVGGVDSNTLPFTITTGTIYFIDVTNGNNANNGLTTSTAWKDLYMFNPGTDNYHTGIAPYSSYTFPGDNQYIVYVRAGTYTTPDYNSYAMLLIFGPYGAVDKQKALIAYPGETPVVSMANVTYSFGFFMFALGNDSLNIGLMPSHYFTVSKMTVDGSTTTLPMTAMVAYGTQHRFIGNTIKNFRPSNQLQAGNVGVLASQYIDIFGNYFYNNGFDEMAHNVYIKTQPVSQFPGDPSLLAAQHIYVGWNEFDTAYSSSGRGNVIFVSKQNPPDSPVDTKYIYIFSNYFHDGTENFIGTGDGMAWVDEVYIYNNVFTGGTFVNVPVICGGGSLTCYVYNNTFYLTADPGYPLIYAGYGSGLSTQPTFNSVNNVLYGATGQRLAFADYGYGTLTSSNDLFFNQTGSILDPIYQNYSWIRETSSVKADPLFVDGPRGNFQLLSSSPAIDHGSSSVGSIVTTDYLGIPRPQGGGFDIGAFEYASGSPEFPPAPTGLSILRNP